MGPDEVGILFFKSGPKWVEKLFDLRNKLVGIFGLKTPGKSGTPKNIPEHFKCEIGDQLGLFKVFDKSDNEIILGEDDKHLDFRVSLFIKNNLEDKTTKSLIISTTVKFNNWFGRLYFLPVRPFHQIIVPVMLKGIIRKIEEDA